MNEQLKKIVQDLVEIREQCRLGELGDEALFDCAVRIYNSQKIENGKEVQKQVQQSQPQPQKAQDPATDGQIRLMKKLRLNIPQGLTKREASHMIDERLNKNKDQDNGNY